jgi:two-component system nitrate/nitrite response regulator NarL
MVRGADLKTITARFPGLSIRERQITTLACDGLSNKAIANRLGLSEGTIKIHLHHIYKKLGIDSRRVLLALLLSRPDRS